MVLKNVSTAALKLLYSSSGLLERFRYAKLAIDFADDVAFQATNDFASVRVKDVRRDVPLHYLNVAANSDLKTKALKFPPSAARKNLPGSV
jgi:hypothetical protein